MKLGKHDHETDLRQDVTVRMRRYSVKHFSENVHCRCVSDVNLSASVAVKSVVRPVLGRDVGSMHGSGWIGRVGSQNSPSWVGRVQCPKCLINMQFVRTKFVDYNS